MATPLPADLNKVDRTEAWKPWTPTADEPWDRKWVAHLFRRAAFGATPAEIDRALTDGFPKTLERLLVGAPDAAEWLKFFSETGEFYTEPPNLRVWWLRMMLESGHPLREKLTLFWHNHFATSYAKTRSTEMMFKQNVTLRKHALGKFRPFLLDMSKDTAMLVWLDSNRNVVGAPNENYAREVMELFSLGVGNYTEKDIREAARAFTGWHTDSAVNDEVFTYKPDEHDEGSKTVFGKTGNWNGDDIVRLCCDQPACAKFLVGKLYAFLVSETPPPKGLLAPLEERFRKSDYDFADLVKTMLGSRFFFSTHAYRKRVKWPVEYTLEAFRAVTPGQVPLSDLLDPLAKMGQVLFAPPNVKGWRTGTDWLNSATLLARNNFAETVALGEWSRQGSRLPRGGAVFETVAQPDPPAQTALYSEEAAAAAAGGSGAAAVAATHTFTDSPDGMMRHIFLTPPGGAKAASGKPSSAPPPPPETGVDPIVTLYATKPKDVATLVARMSELLYGERIAATQTAKIEKFLREPLTAPANESPAKNDPRKKSGKTEPVPPTTSTSKAPTEEPKKSNAPNLESPEFKARVREALHAMMCLPEYQLN
jgi:hypothetical protein